jgi:hypothetical protein
MGGVKINRKLMLALILSLSMTIFLNIVDVYAVTGNQTTSSNNTNINANFTVKEVSNASSRVANLSNTYNITPNYVEIYSNNQIDYQISLPQFTILLTNSVLNVNNNIKTPITLKNVAYPTTPINNFKSGVIYKAEYLSIAQNIKNFITTNGRVPNYINTSLGLMRYEPAVLMYSKIMNFYNINNRLPNYVTMSAWNANRPVYITSDNINNNTVDTARVNDIITELKMLGVPAYAEGIGPSASINVLENNKIPENALVVNIFGGVDAGCISEMTGNWYKSIKGERKVFTLLLSTSSVRITGLNWLQRAHDDNYDPPSFTGIARPDLDLLNNGYDYIEGILPNDIQSMVYFILKETMT